MNPIAFAPFYAESTAVAATLGRVFATARELGELANRLEQQGKHHTEEYRAAIIASSELAILGYRLEREFGVTAIPVPLRGVRP